MTGLPNIGDIINKNKSYIERLKILNLPTLKYRRYRGDIIELFKILKGIYDPSCSSI